MDSIRLKFLINGNTNVSSKRKIFCAHHPNDFRYLNEVFQDISEACECTLFYYESGKEPKHEEQLKMDLASMNLFVLIVTSDFLFKSCFANEVAFDFAVKHSIPVLPILLESGLEEVFNEKVGNLQCLSKFQEKIDATTVPYNEKLKNYLDQVLSTDIDIERFRSAFDTSIFLSYRKKDRKYAQKLMELIHEDDTCRNIAIWYDEFLVPGEDFNDGIRTELEQSSMFVLVVTPHIVESDNYITLTEYPMATTLQKTVIPFEMEPTDGEKLKVFCPGIEKTNDTTNGEQVRKVILNALNELGIVQSDSTAERTFLIGLAYLKGICVEKNSEVGFSMIVAAADAGVPEAMRNLVFSYRNGEGTEQNLSLAIVWQKRLLSMHKNICEKNSCDENMHTVLKTYFELAEIQNQSGNFEDTQDTYTEVVEFCSNEEIKDLIYVKKYKAMAYELAGKLWMAQGNYDKAQHGCFQQALHIREELCENESTMRSTLELIEVRELIGECCENANDVVGVKTQMVYIKKLIPEAEHIEASVENYDLLRRFMLCNNKLGHLYNVLNMWEEAFVSIGSSVLLAEKMIQISETADSKRQLMLAHINDGDQHVKCNVENHYGAALGAYQMADMIVAQLVLEKESLETQLDMANIQEKIGYVLSKIETDEMAIRYYESALEGFRSAYELAGTLPINRKLYQCCIGAARVYQHSGDSDKALELLKESEKLNADALNRSNLTVLRIELAETLATIGGIYKAQWEIDEALDYFRRSHALLKEALNSARRVKELKLYIGSFQELIATSKLAGDFKTVKELTVELKSLYDEYHMFLN